MLAACCVAPFALSLGSIGTTDIYSDGIAVIHIDGVIAGTASSSALSAGGEITPEYLIDMLQAADEDPGIEAILLRIDSPGGTAAASQEIAMEVARVRKPVIASVGDIAASGAFWIASQCDAIVATPSSAVGSIGVILQIPNYEGLLDKIGVEYTIITKGEFKDAGSPFRSINATELAMLEEDMDFIYEEFIAGVAEGRGLEVDEVREMATGWVWNASSGQEMGLVDELGTYQDALDVAAERAGLDDYEVIYYDEPTPWDLIYWFLTTTENLSRMGEVRLEDAGAPPVAR
jgi:protease-4